jgi:hypothetical protein
LGIGGAAFAAPPVNAPIIGEIERITVNNINNHWSRGEIVVGGQIIIIPENLLLDLPANRLTLQQLFTQAPAACLATGESGLAKADICNTSGAGGIATISANRTSNGNIIAGDALIQKGIEAVTGAVTYIDYNDGYFRLNGRLNDATTGVMVRLNDPAARHTVQQGPGCTIVGPAEPNCSPDPRFTLDADNYTNVFSTGYPICIPSTVQRRFQDLLDLDGDGITTDFLNAQSNADGTGDRLCPRANRQNIAQETAVDSRRFAPIKLGDSLTAEGNFETINGVRFVSAHTVMVSKALVTQDIPSQPDYLFLDEVEVDAPGFQNQRARTLIIGYTTLAPSDVLIWSLHYDPVANEPHEVPLATVRGCDLAAGDGTCGQQGLVGAGNRIFKIRHDVDFLIGADPRLDPCAHMRADSRFNADRATFNLCATSSIADMFRVLSPIPHEIQARTGHSLANPGLITLDIKGEQATNGQYLFPFGMNLGGIATPEFNEIDLNALNTPVSFSGIPWNLDRRLSPGGCIDTTGDGVADCEATPIPLRPFPFEELDPRTLASVPAAAANRILSFYPFGASDVLAWPPEIPGRLAITPTPPLVFACGAATASTISGRVTTGLTARGVGGVTMTLTDAVSAPVATTLTDFNGNYLFAGVANGSYTITPGKDVRTFTPVSLAVTITTPGPVTGQHFTSP